MTKEELEKEAEENSFRYTLDKPWACEVERKQIMAHFEKGYLASAEPREKQIQIDAEQILALQKQNGELTDKVKALENDLKWERDTKSELGEHLGKANDKISDLEDKLANADYQLEGRDNEITELKEQIKEMKCCDKCAHCNTYITSCIPQKRFVRLEDVCEDFELRR